MTATEWAAFFGSMGGGAAAAFAGLKWWVGRIDANALTELTRQDKLRSEEINRQDELREELRADMQRRIDELMKTVSMQGQLINGYMKHVRVLENTMAKAGLEVPELTLDDLIAKFQ